MMIGSWPRGVLMMSSFEVSHISVWRSDVCKGIRQSLVADTLGTQIYTDALIHTVCALASTKPTEMIKFDMKEIPYESILDVATTHKVMFEAKGVSNATRDSGVYATKPLVPAYEDQFSVRDFGWMGADIISSFGFPSIADVNHDLHSSSSKDTRHRRAMPSHYVWLFGDSLIGTANEMRRLGGSIISNTVGLAHMNYTNTVGLKSDKVGNVSAISRIDFHWGSNDDGSAKPLFKSIDSIIRNTTYPFAADAAERRDNIERAYYMPAFWPYSGVTVIKRTSATDLTVMADNVRLVVLGQYILSAHATGLQGILATANPSLSFREVCSAIFVVDNPYAPPGQWQYAHTVIPTPKWGQYRWLAMSETQGQPYAYSYPRTNAASQNTSDPAVRKQQAQHVASVTEDSSDVLYVLGSYNSDAQGDQYNEQFDIASVAIANAYMTVSKISSGEAARNDFSSMRIACVKDSANTVYDDTTDVPEWLKDEVVWKPTAECTQPYKLFDPVITEPSFHFDTRLRHYDQANFHTRKSHSNKDLKGRWVTSSLRMEEKAIKMCMTESDHVLGPWHCELVMNVPGKWMTEDYTTYGAKIHPELTYNSNGHSEDSLEHDNSQKSKNAIDFVISYGVNLLKHPRLLFMDGYKDTYVPKFSKVTVNV
jgi:hypothetical protein